MPLPLPGPRLANALGAASLALIVGLCFWLSAEDARDYQARAAAVEAGAPLPDAPAPIDKRRGDQGAAP